MKTLFLIAFLQICCACFCQGMKERDKINRKFENSKPPTIHLFSSSQQIIPIDSIEIRSKYLKRKKIESKILLFKISAIAKDSSSLVFSERIEGHIIPERINTKIKNCTSCAYIKIENITLRWFTGTYTLRVNQMWKIKN